MLSGVTAADLKHLLLGAGATFLRVNVSLAIAAAWTIPVGVMIGFNPRLARILQPVIQVVASVPATALFPVLLLALIRIGGGLGIGSIALMLLGAQWYILFNVIAGAMAIPSDLERGCLALPFYPLAALDHADPARHLPVSRHRPRHCLRRRLERLHHRRILPLQRPDPADDRPRRADQRRHRPGQILNPSARHRAHGPDGGYDQPACLAAALSPGRNPV